MPLAAIIVMTQALSTIYLMKLTLIPNHVEFISICSINTYFLMQYVFSDLHYAFKMYFIIFGLS